MNYRVNKTSQKGQSILESVQKRGAMAEIAVRLPTVAAEEIAEAVTLFHKEKDKSEERKFHELLIATDDLDAGQMEILFTHISNHFANNTDVINNMDAEAISLVLKTASTLVKNRIGE